MALSVIEKPANRVFPFLFAGIAGCNEPDNYRSILGGSATRSGSFDETWRERRFNSSIFASKICFVHAKRRKDSSVIACRRGNIIIVLLNKGLRFLEMS